MKYSTCLLALLSVALASLPDQENEQQSEWSFTVNLLTRVKDMAITSPNTQIPIGWANATIHQDYNDAREGNVEYSVIGSVTFNDERSFQAYHIETKQWDADIAISLRKRGNVSNLDIAVSKEDPSGTGMRFDYLSTNHGGVDVANIITRMTPKLGE